MEPKKHLVALECFCVKKAEATASTSASISAKLSCGPAMIKGGLLGAGHLECPELSFCLSICFPTPLPLGHGNQARRTCPGEPFQVRGGKSVWCV